MIVIYQPKGAEPEQYDADELACSEADAVCRVTEMQWVEIGQALRQQSPAALRAVAWAWRKRSEPTLRLSAFDPPLKALKARFDTEEIPDFLKQLGRTGLTAAERAQALQEVVDMALDPDAAAAVIEAETAPKAQPAPTGEPGPSPSSDASTSLSSPIS